MPEVFSHIEHDKNLFEAAIPFDRLNVSPEEVIHTLGYANGSEPEYFLNLIKTILLDAHDRCNIQAGYCLAPVQFSKDHSDEITVNGTRFHVQRIIASQFKTAASAAIFLCTIGPGMEQWSKESLQEGDQVKSFLIDAAASALTERAVEFLHTELGEYYSRKNLKITNRYSPGYCHWATAEQQLLFSFFPNQFCGVSLTESSLMIPKKSISGIIGIGADVRWNHYPCHGCSIPNCTYRSHQAKKTKTIVSNH